MILGRGNGDSAPGRLTSHRGSGPNPSVSAAQTNPTRNTGAVGTSSFQQVKDGLVRTHGIFMLIAWPLLANTAIFLAAYMRPALPNGEWFQAHRALMIISLFVGAAGFILIFIAQLRSATPGLITLGSQDVRTCLVTLA